MGPTAKLALLLGFETILLVTPMMWPTIPFEVGLAAYALAACLLVYAACDLARSYGMLPVFLSSRWRLFDGPWPDLDKWDRQKEITLKDVAYLWENQEPAGFPLPRKIESRFQSLGEAIRTHVLKVHPANTREAVELGIDVSRGRGDFTADPNWVLRRGDLVNYAYGEGKRPKFLFPKERVPTRKGWWARLKVRCQRTKPPMR
jgi:hypothetical protein